MNDTAARDGTQRQGDRMSTIYTLGYQGSSPDAVKAYVEDLGALLVDIRYAPYSRDPRWVGSNIRNWLGNTRYIQCGGYGNENYRGGQIKLFHPEAAAWELRTFLERQNIILLCACANVETCHRKAAAEHLSTATGAPVVHLPGKPERSLPENSVRALTLTQPWASLIFCPDPELRKQYETRSWQTPYRGRIAIHAAKGLSGMKESDMWILALSEPFRAALQACDYMSPGRLPRGVVLGTVDLVSITSALALASSLSATERAFGDYSMDRYAWELANPVLFETPIPARGALGLWTWNEKAADIAKNHETDGA